MLKHYYITLKDKYFCNYADVYAQNKENAEELAVKKYGIMNVSTVYTERAWSKKYTKVFSYIGKIENDGEEEYLRRKHII